MNRQLQTTLLILLFAMLPTVAAQDGSYSGTWSGTYDGTTDSTGTGSFNGNLTGNATGTIQINSTTFSQFSPFEYTVAARDVRQTATTQIDFDLLSDVLGVLPAAGKTMLRWGFGCELRPTGLASATCEGTMSSDFALIPGGGTDGCSLIIHRQPTGAPRENPYKEGHCDLSGGPFSGAGNVTCTISLTNAIEPNCWWEIVQIEIYSISTSISSTEASFDGTISGPLSGTTSSTLSGSESGTLSGNESGDLFGVGGGDGNATVNLTDHNVTVIDGDTNIPEMRVFAWFVAVTLFFVFMGEWKKDAVYYLMAALSSVFTIVNWPSFLPLPFIVLPLGLGMYMIARIARLKQSAERDESIRGD